MAGGSWTALVLTCQNKDSAHAYQRELENRQQKGFIDPDVLILSVEDPKFRVGSGGATLNALLVVSEYLSARQGFTVINPDVLQGTRILIMHMGRDYPHDSCGKAFMTLPVKFSSPYCDGLISNIDMLIDTITNKLAANSPPGLWVCSTDMLLTVPENIVIDWKGECDVVALSIPDTVRYAKYHGVYKINEQGFVRNIIFRGEYDAIEACARWDSLVPLVGGVVYFSNKMAEKFLSFHVLPPLDACTYMGLDSGAIPIELSLFYDFMLPMCTDVTEEQYLNGVDMVDSPASMQTDQKSGLAQARSLLWKHLHGIKIKAIVIEGGQFNYISMIKPASEHQRLILQCPLQIVNRDNLQWTQRIHSHIHPEAKIGEESVIINSVIDREVEIGSQTAISHCRLRHCTVGRESMINGLDIINTHISRGKVTFADSMCVNAFNLKMIPQNLHSANNMQILTVVGKFDDLLVPMWKGTSTYCNIPWVIFLNRTGIKQEDLWPASMKDESKCIFNARLFPVLNLETEVGLREMIWLQSREEGNNKMLTRWRSSWRLSFTDLLPFSDLSKEFELRRGLFFDVAYQYIGNILVSGYHHGLQALYRAAVVEGYHQQILETLDSATEANVLNPGIVARVLVNIADVLGCMARQKGGLRSGPAANKQWNRAFAFLKENTAASTIAGIKSLAEERRRWLDRPDHLVRAARHYEGAAQILIRQAVLTGKTFIKTEDTEIPPLGVWVRADAPARLDLAGGWSDTPPITYEHGGAVLNAAILFDGQKPIGAKVCRIHQKQVVLVMSSLRGEGTRLVLEDLSDFDDYAQPHAPGALLKAAFICAEIIEVDSDVELKDQLANRYDGGFELHTWSYLPHGSGLGTSSILAGAIMAALWKASGKLYDMSSLLHAVLYLEQILTTGGGWQDQVGGLTGGIKVGHSKAELPLFIDYTMVNVQPEIIRAFNEQMLLVYTGKTRLAKNLLQNVIRNWYAMDPGIIETEDALVELAWKAAKALEANDFAKLGKCMNEYWILKKRVATGCEPIAVRQMMTALGPYIHGATLAGAGGGGFMYVLMKEPNSVDMVRQVLSTIEGAEGATVHTAVVCEDGLSVYLEE